MVPFVKEIEVAPADGAKVGEPHPLVVPPGVEATCICAGEVGKVSENWTLERASFRFGFVIVKVRVEVPPARMGLGENSFEMLGGFKTVRDALATPVVPVFVPPSVEEMNSLILL
jgi:hypothetical protein